MCILKGVKAEIKVEDSFFAEDEIRYDYVSIEPPFSSRVVDERIKEAAFYDPDNMCIKLALLSVV